MSDRRSFEALLARLYGNSLVGRSMSRRDRDLLDELGYLIDDDAVVAAITAQPTLDARLDPDYLPFGRPGKLTAIATTLDRIAVERRGTLVARSVTPEGQTRAAVTSASTPRARESRSRRSSTASASGRDKPRRDSDDDPAPLGDDDARGDA